MAVQLSEDRLGAKAELFGAVGDGQHNDSSAIKECLAAYNACFLGPKVYAIDRPIQLGSGAVLEGWQGRSTLRLMNSAGGLPANRAWVALVESTDPHGGTPSDNVVVRNLILDCNFGGQPKRYHTLQGVVMRGAGCLLENLKVIHFQAGLSGSECFVLFAYSARNQVNAKGNVIRGCEITEIASNKGIVTTGPLMVSCLGSGGCDDAHKVIGPVIEKCYVHDISTSPDQTVMVNCMGVSSAIGAFVQQNTVRNVYGQAFYCDTYANDWLTIRDNQYLGVRVGVYLNTREATYSNVMVYGNMIDLSVSYSYDETIPYSWIREGIATYRRPSLNNVLIQDNVIRGGVWTDTQGVARSPNGIWFNMSTTGYRGIIARQNTIDLGSATSRYGGRFWDASTWDSTQLHWGENRDSQAALVGLNIETPGGVKVKETVKKM